MIIFFFITLTLLQLLLLYYTNAPTVASPTLCLLHCGFHYLLCDIWKETPPHRSSSIPSPILTLKSTVMFAILKRYHERFTNIRWFSSRRGKCRPGGGGRPVILKKRLIWLYRVSLALSVCNIIHIEQCWSANEKKTKKINKNLYETYLFQERRRMVFCR